MVISDLPVGIKKAGTRLVKVLSARFSNQSKDLGKCERILIYVRKETTMNLTRAHDEELHRL